MGTALSHFYLETFLFSNSRNEVHIYLAGHKALPFLLHLFCIPISRFVLSLLSYFIMDMEDRMSSILERRDESAKEQLKTIFQSQLKTFVQKPSIVSVVFSEGIFQFNKQLAEKLSDMMQMMNGHIERLIEKGKEDGEFITLIGSQTMATIVMGSMRMVVLKWKLSGHKSNLLKDGNSILNGLLIMFEKSN
jgi:hypothetical protein